MPTDEMKERIEEMKAAAETCKRTSMWRMDSKVALDFEHVVNPDSVLALIAEIERLREVLEDANSLCRSAMAIAKRQGLQTNWTAFEDQLQGSLSRQHEAMYGDLAQHGKKGGGGA